MTVALSHLVPALHPHTALSPTQTSPPPSPLGPLPPQVHSTLCQTPLLQTPCLTACAPSSRTAAVLFCHILVTAFLKSVTTPTLECGVRGHSGTKESGGPVIVCAWIKGSCAGWGSEAPRDVSRSPGCGWAWTLPSRPGPVPCSSAWFIFSSSSRCCSVVCSAALHFLRGFSAQETPLGKGSCCVQTSRTSQAGPTEGVWPAAHPVVGGPWLSPGGPGSGWLPEVCKVQGLRVLGSERETKPVTFSICAGKATPGGLLVSCCVTWLCHPTSSRLPKSLPW